MLCKKCEKEINDSIEVCERGISESWRDVDSGCLEIGRKVFANFESKTQLGEGLEQQLQRVSISRALIDMNTRHINEYKLKKEPQLPDTEPICASCGVKLD